MAPLSKLWFCSRTPTVLGQTVCAYKRFLEYHSGPNGLGLRRKSTAVPLATGAAVHTGLELLGNWLKESDATTAPPDAVAWAATEAAARYEAKARKRGLLVTLTDATAAAAIDQLILEQSTLVEAIVWIAALYWLPGVLTNYKIIDVEWEETIVLDCSCGLGEAIVDHHQHDQRGCAGIVQMGRADWLLVNRLNPAQIAYAEFKTKSSQRQSWELSWEHSGQLLVSMEAASRRIGTSVSEAWIPTFYKGWRGRDRSEPLTAPKTQHSPLCYGYFEAARPPFNDANWSAKYRWVDDIGRGHTLSKTYNKVAIWDEANEMAPCRAGASRVETWVTNFITSEIVFAESSPLIKVVGPIPRPVNMVPKAMAAIVAEESRWRADLEFINSDGVRPEQVIPRSWQCTGYDGTPCEFRPHCFDEPNWEDLYEPRTPHHGTEKTAAEARGVTFASDEDEDEADD